MLETLAGKVAPLGWHVQVFAHPEQLLVMEPPVASGDADLVDLLLAWCGDDQTLHPVLVDTPARLYGFD